MAKQVAPGGSVHEIFAVPANSTVLTPKFFSNGADVTGEVLVTGPTKVNATATSHAYYTVSFTVPGGATNRKVYQMLINWKDPSGTLQPPLLFEAQAVVDATASSSIEISQ